MTRQSRRAKRIEITPELREAVKQGELDNRLLQEHPEAHDPFRGQWVVVHKQKVIAHSPDGREAARAAPAAQYPGALLEYVPAREKAEAIHIYTPIFGAPAQQDAPREAGTE